MTLKATITLFFVTLAILQSNGCFNEVLKTEFDSIDEDKDGFLNQHEICQPILSNSRTEDTNAVKDYCFEVWKIMDLNEDGKATCQGMYFFS